MDQEVRQQVPFFHFVSGRVSLDFLFDVVPDIDSLVGVQTTFLHRGVYRNGRSVLYCTSLYIFLTIVVRLFDYSSIMK